ncbi:MAG: VOC family protein [Pseudomonadales bacterium]|jgi:catechol 2,3-dioxygenase-like lactoylglutathione lyase family enzyme|nr:VOC family protein [Pseudomonadales bacterium]
MNDLTVRLPETAEARGRIAPKHFAHIVYKTPRFAEMIDWYSTVLECEPVLKNDLLCFMTYDDEHHRIAIANQPQLKDKPADVAGVEHCAYTYGSLADLAATYERLKAAGITPYWCINHGFTLSMYYRDPDRNQVELQVDLFDDAAATTAWLEQSDFASNPIGVKFDPDEFARRLKAGEDLSDILERRRIDPSELHGQFPEGGL